MDSNVAMTLISSGLHRAFHLFVTNSGVTAHSPSCHVDFTFGRFGNASVARWFHFDLTWDVALFLLTACIASASLRLAFAQGWLADMRDCVFLLTASSLYFALLDRIAITV